MQNVALAFRVRCCIRCCSTFATNGETANVFAVETANVIAVGEEAANVFAVGERLPMFLQSVSYSRSGNVLSCHNKRIDRSATMRRFENN